MVLVLITRDYGSFSDTSIGIRRHPLIGSMHLTLRPEKSNPTLRGDKVGSEMLNSHGWPLVLWGY